MSELKLNLYQKIHAVMKDISYLRKDDKVEFGKTKYKAISEEKVTTTVRQSLIKYGLVVLPVKQTSKKEGNITSTDTTYKIIDIDTGEFELLASSGEGADTQDKGVGKAMTYSYKYLFLRSFAIPTGEDPDKISSAELDAEEEKNETKSTEKNESKVATLKAKWNSLAGSLEGFDDFYDKQLKAGYNETQMDVFLTKKLKMQESKGD